MPNVGRRFLSHKEIMRRALERTQRVLEDTTDRDLALDALLSHVEEVLSMIPRKEDKYSEPVGAN